LQVETVNLLENLVSAYTGVNKWANYDANYSTASGYFLRLYTYNKLMKVLPLFRNPSFAPMDYVFITTFSDYKMW